MQTASSLPNDPVLLPMQRTLDKAELFKLRGGLVLWLMSMAIPILLLVETRFVLVGGYVSPSVSQGVGIASLIALVIGALFASMASQAAKRDNRGTITSNYGWAIFFGFVAWVLIGVQIVNGSMAPTSHYGETYLISAGTVDFYVTCVVVGLYAARSRVKRLGSLIQNYWGVYATTTVMWFVVVSWLVMYLVLYWM